MANIIATERLAYIIGGSGGGAYTSNLAATKVRAQALGCNIRGTYADNQLVNLKDLAKDINTYCTCNTQCGCNMVCGCNDVMTCEGHGENRKCCGHNLFICLSVSYTQCRPFTCTGYNGCNPFNGCCCHVERNTYGMECSGGYCYCQAVAMGGCTCWLKYVCSCNKTCGCQSGNCSCVSKCTCDNVCGFDCPANETTP